MRWWHLYSLIWRTANLLTSCHHIDCVCSMTSLYRYAVDTPRQPSSNALLSNLQDKTNCYYCWSFLYVKSNSVADCMINYQPNSKAWCVGENEPKLTSNKLMTCAYYPVLLICLWYIIIMEAHHNTRMALLWGAFLWLNLLTSNLVSKVYSLIELNIK